MRVEWSLLFVDLIKNLATEHRSEKKERKEKKEKKEKDKKKRAEDVPPVDNVPVPQGYSNTVVNNAPYAAGGYNSGGAMPGVADPYGPGAPVGGGFPAQPGMSAPYR